MPNSYALGQNVRCSVVIRDVATQALVDPTGVRFMVREPNDTVTTHVYGVDPELIKDGVGQYHDDVTLDDDGDWYYRWEGTGTHIGACENRMCVRKSVFYEL